MKPRGETARRLILAIVLTAAIFAVPRSLSSEPVLKIAEPAPRQTAQGAVLVSGLRPPLPNRGGDAAAAAFFSDFLAAPSLASRIIAAEGRPQANPASTAAGYGQFLRGTWLEIFARAYPQLADKFSSDQILALRQVKPLALELTDRYAQRNAFSLNRAGLPATEASLSLAHALGPGGAISILVSRPDERVANVLSGEAIAANPFMNDMTAGALQQWATRRIRLPAEPAQPKRATLRFEEEKIEPLTPAEDFRVDGQTKASQVLAENRTTIAALQSLLQAAAAIGAGDAATLAPPTAAWLNSVGIDPADLLLAHPAALQLFHKSAAQLVLDTIHRLASRSAYRAFKPIERNAGARGELRPGVVRDMANALIDKMRRENSTVITIVRHRRSFGVAHPTARSDPREGAS